MVDVFAFGTREHNHGITTIVFVESGGRTTGSHTTKERRWVHAAHCIVFVHIAGIELIGYVNNS